MRLGALLVVASSMLPAVAAAQEYSRSARPASGSVLRPASTVGWRNYATVPDGPCGPPMTVQTDCYVNCRPCGPLRPFCFLHRVGRMFDSLIPCNLCCRSGCGHAGGGSCGRGGGLFHGCILGGRKYGCNVCCGAPAHGGGCGGGCGCAHPCGSAFGSCCAPSCSTPSCTTGGHCYGCSSALPGLSDPFIDDPLPMPLPPKPTAESATEVRGTATEVRRAPPRPARPAAAQPRVTTAAPAKQQSPYKIVRATGDQPQRQTAPASEQSVLRRASMERSSAEPATLKTDQRRAAPIVRSQSPDDAEMAGVPSNPLR